MELTEVDIIRRFAVALDEEDYGAARAVLSAGCVYVFRGEVYEGAEAIVESYAGIGRSHRRLDARCRSLGLCFGRAF